MDEFHGSATARVGAHPQAVFDLICDLDRLPASNTAIEQIIERPAALTKGAEWVAVMHPRRVPPWKSRSRIEEIDRDRLRFSYTSRNEDGNPSYAVWSWEVASADDGATDVTVRWDVYLKTIDRKLIAAPVRRRGLAREVPASLHALENLLRSPSPEARRYRNKP
jgi:Polyketide cyclase / dehydrase and lipid transport